MMSVADESPVQPMCPKCSGPGLARGLEIKHDRRTMRYECERCHHEWHIADIDPVVTWNGIPIEPS